MNQSFDSTSSSPLQGWAALVQQALIGNALRTDGVAELWQQWAKYGLTPPTDAPPEQRLLQAAAVYHYLQTAAQQLPPSTNLSTLPTAPAETLPYCSDQRLGQVRYALRYQYDEVLVEVLASLQAEETLLPPVVLPPLLDYAQKQPDLQALVLATAGKRGQWLAQYRDAWAYARAVDVEDATPFYYGNKEERITYLKGLLQQAPVTAISLIENVWAQESTASRIALLKLLPEHAASEALALLERAHQDPRKGVRKAATRLLTNLPTSSIVKRMKALLIELITVEKGELCIVLPDTCTPEMAQDGINTGRDLVNYQGYKANLLAQLIAAVPPQWWTEYYGWTATQWIEAVQQTQWTSAFIGGWAYGAHRFGADDWLWKCQQWCVAQLKGQALLGVDLEFVYAGLSPALFERFAQLLMTIGDQQILPDEHPVITLLLTHGQKWSHELSKIVLNRIRQTIERERYVFHWNLKAVLKHAAIAIPADLFPTLEKNWQHSDGAAWASFQKEIQYLFSLLRFRWEVQQGA